VWAGLAVVAAPCFVVTLDAMVLYVAFGDIRRDVPDVGAAALWWIHPSYTQRKGLLCGSCNP